MRHGILGIGALAFVATAAPLRAEPAISITSLPPYGALGSIGGSATGVDPATHHVAVYLYVDGAGWFTKPTFAQPTVPIAPDAGFVADVTTGGLASLDPSASLYCAALLPIATAPPLVDHGVRIPPFEPLAIDCEQRFGRTIGFANWTWGVKEAPSPVGPGGNVFSLAEDDAFVDESGKLHLTIHGSEGAWRATEVVLLDPLGYGTYSFVTEGDLANLDPFATFGAFTWDPYGDETGASGNANREIDFEVSRWGEPQDPDNAQAVVQPWDAPGNRDRFSIPSGTLYWSISWFPARVQFQVSAGGDEAYSWTYRSPFLPSPGAAQFHLNLWPNGAGLGGPAEVIVSDFMFAPEPDALAATLAAVATLLALRRPARGGVC